MFKKPEHLKLVPRFEGCDALQVDFRAKSPILKQLKHELVQSSATCRILVHCHQNVTKIAAKPAKLEQTQKT